MVTSGQVITNREYDSYFWVKWSQIEQDKENNRTNIAWSCGLYSEHQFLNNAIKMSAFAINGIKVYGGGTYSNFTAEGEQLISSGSLWIEHNEDGTKTFSISSFTGWLYKDHNYSAAASSHTLTQIPRKAKITAAADFTDLDSPSISFSNPGGFRMDVWLEPNPVGDHLCVRENIPNTGSYTWTLTNDERNALRSHCTGPNCTIRLGLYSHLGGTVDADYKDKTFSVKESDSTKPTVNMEITLNNGTVTGFDDLFIQGKSSVDVRLSAEGKFNATIQSYYAEIEGKIYEASAFTSNAFRQTGTVDIVGYAKDTREITGSAKRQVNVIEYAKPVVVPISGENAILCYRSDGNGYRNSNSTSLWVKAKRSYHSVAGRNHCALQWRRKLVKEEWDNGKHLWEDLIPATNSNTAYEYNALLPAVFDLKQSYTVQIRAIDSIGEDDTKTFEVPTQDVALHLGRGGKNVAIGTYCDYSEDYTFYSAWKALFDNGIYIEGTKVSNHVVEEGTDGAWKYRKWNDGTVELWSVITAVHHNGSILGGELSYPFALTGTIYGIATLNSAGGNSGGALPWNLKLTYGTDLCGVWIHNSGSTSFEANTTLQASVYIVGGWK